MSEELELEQVGSGTEKENSKNNLVDENADNDAPRASAYRMPTSRTRDFFTQGSTVFDPALFWANVLSIVLFPASLVFRIARNYQIILAALPSVGFWIYTVFFYIYADERENLFDIEPVIVFTLLVIVAIDNSISAANPQVDMKIGNFLNYWKLLAQYTLEDVENPRNGCCGGFFKNLRLRVPLMLQMSTVKPAGEVAKIARRRLRDTQITLRLDRNKADLTKCGLLYYDCISETIAEDAEDIHADTLGPSYFTHCTRNPEAIPLENLAAWFAVRDYAYHFSLDTLEMYAMRLSLVGVFLVACFCYLLLIYIRGNLNEESLFTSYVVITFITSSFYVLVIVLYGYLANVELDYHRNGISSKGMASAEKQFLDIWQRRPPHSPRSASKVEDCNGLLSNGLQYLQSLEYLNWFGQPLDASYINLIFTFIISSSVSVAPILLDTFGIKLF